MLNEKGNKFTIDDFEILTKLKESLCYVPVNYEKEIEKFKNSPSSIEKLFKLPDGKEIKIGEERFKVTEMLFNPSLVGNDIAGINQNINESILKCDLDVRRIMFSNIILSGGNTMFDGFKEKITNGLKESFKGKIEINVIDNKDRNLSSWIGGSIMASTNVNSLSKDEYKESGVDIVHQIFY
jgi:actin, other eukaryote